MLKEKDKKSSKIANKVVQIFFILYWKNLGSNLKKKQL